MSDLIWQRVSATETSRQELQNLYVCGISMVNVLNF